MDYLIIKKYNGQKETWSTMNWTTVVDLVKTSLRNAEAEEIIVFETSYDTSIGRTGQKCVLKASWHPHPQSFNDDGRNFYVIKDGVKTANLDQYDSRDLIFDEYEFTFESYWFDHLQTRIESKITLL